MAELAQRLGFDLADALARHIEFLADLFERMRLSVDQTEAHAKHLLFARGKRREHFFKLLAQQRIRRLFRRLRGFVVLNEIAQMAVLFLRRLHKSSTMRLQHMLKI